MVKMSLEELEGAINTTIIRDDLKEQFKFVARSIFNDYKEAAHSTPTNKQSVPLCQRCSESSGCIHKFDSCYFCTWFCE